jgi:hypothetical protein
VPSGVDFENDANDSNLTTQVVAPCNATPSTTFFQSDPPTPWATGPKLSYQGKWNHQARKKFYGDDYSGVPTLLVGGVALTVVNVLPSWGFSSNSSSAQQDAIAATCKTVPGYWNKIPCAGINCFRLERYYGGACKETASCTNRVLRKMGYDADVLTFSMSLTVGHAVVTVKSQKGVWRQTMVYDPTWNTEYYWVK